MRILLIVPTHHYNPTGPEVTFLSVSDLPQGFPYLAAVLKKAGHEVFGLSPNNVTGYTTGYAMIKDLITKRIKDCNPQLIGLGGICTDYHFIKDAIGIIRKLFPLTPIVLGGGIVTHDAEFIMNHLKPDFCIVGEAEKAIIELVGALAYKTHDLQFISNIGYWEE